MGVLITGGAGFIGAEVARMLLGDGEDAITVFSRNPTRDRLGALADKVRAVSGDVGNYTHVLAAVEDARPDTIYHLGAMFSTPSEADHSGSIQTNAMGTYHVLEAARLFGVRQVIFASSIATFGTRTGDGVMRDDSLQRPTLIYGACKVFAEHMGLWYRRKFGLDFRGLRYPSVVGPGVRTPGITQYTSWMIETAARGEPFTVWVREDTRCPVLYYRDAAKAAVQLAGAPHDDIAAVNYLVDGIVPTPSAGEIAAAVRARIPGADIAFETDEERQTILDAARMPMDDSRAREEWGWAPAYDLDGAVDDLIEQARARQGGRP